MKDSRNIGVFSILERLLLSGTVIAKMKVVFISFGPCEKPLRHIRASHDEEIAISRSCAITGHSKPRVPTWKKSICGFATAAANLV